MSRSRISRGLAATLVAGALLALPEASPLTAQEPEPDSARLAELERRLEALTRDLERQRLGDEVVVADTSVGGFGLGASKVYRVQAGVSIGGYGEILYQNYAAERQDGTPAGRSDQVDALRAIVYLGYKFDDRVLFNSEIEIEHGNEAYLEFAYLDVLLTDDVGLRAGLLLAPIGLVNELHEPPIFLGTRRTQVESRIIPTTWRENGIGLFGDNGDVSWRLYLMNGLDGAGFDADGFRGGRQKGSRALAEDFGVAARLDWNGVPALTLGGSVYTGEADQGRLLDGVEVDGGHTIWELHADYKNRGWELRGLLAGASVADAGAMNRLNGLTSGAGLAEHMSGAYVQVGYDVLRTTATTQALIPYLSWETVDTQSEAADGFSASLSDRFDVLELGVAWEPVPQAVFKAGYQIVGNDDETGVDQFNIQLGWLF
ncbi:MAG: hypothetical protein RLN75_06010 [Longimicrobiales bacterium]